MHIETKAFILSYIKFGDTSLIIRFFTQTKGFQTILWKGVLTPKNKNKGLVYPFNEVRIFYKEAKNNGLGVLSKIQNENNLRITQLHISQGNVLLFLSEFVSNALQHENENTSLYEFINYEISAFVSFVKTENFVMKFMLKLSSFLGFFPENNYKDSWFFDLENGKFSKETSVNNFNEYHSQIWHLFLKNPDFQFNREERIIIIDLWLEYYVAQLSDFKKPKSFEVILELYR